MVVGGWATSSGPDCCHPATFLDGFASAPTSPPAGDTSTLADPGVVQQLIELRGK